MRFIRTNRSFTATLALLFVVIAAAPIHAAQQVGVVVDEDRNPAAMRLRAGKFTLNPSASLHRAAGANGNALSAGGRFVVQLDGSLTPQRIADFAAAGVQLGPYLPNHAYIVRLPAGFDPVAKLGGAPFVRWIGPFENAWKLDPAIGQEVLKSVPRLALARQNRLQLCVSLFEGEGLAAALAPIQAVLGAVVVNTQQSGGVARIMVTIPKDQYAQLADISAVQWVEEVAEIEQRNYPGNWIAQSNVPDAFPIWTHDLTGLGQIGGLIDGAYAATGAGPALNADHCSFRDPGGNPIGPTHRKLVAYFGPGSYDLHATHTSGTMVGDEQPISGLTTDRGAAYGAKLAFTNINQLNFPLSLYSMLAQDGGAGATVHSNSWGGSGTNYNIWCVDIDKYSFDNEDQLVVFAVNNLGSITKPENAKNVLAVAATNDAPNQHTQCFGGAGPTADGRRRPEIMAAGCGVVSSASSGATCLFQPDGGTSMACPLIAGSGLLVRQYFVEGYYPSGAANAPDAFTPSGALIKSVLLNSTVDMSGIADFPNNQEGWGRLLLDDALYFTGDSRKLLVLDDRRNAVGLTTGQSTTYAGVVTGASEPLRMTLVWTEKEAALNANPAYINNLDLEVTVAGPTLYRGNVFSGGQSVTGGTADAKNNTEQVLLLSPPTGPFSVTIRATAVNTVGPQGFALVATGKVAPPLAFATSPVPLDAIAEVAPTVVCTPADMNNDGLVNGDDIQLFINVILTGSGTPQQLCSADVNQDTVRNSSDVPAFVQCETAAGPCPP